jgi:hypothetical protein
MSDVFVVVAIGPMQLSGCDVQQSPYVVGTPGPTAVAGAGHALVRDWRRCIPVLQDRGTALLLRPEHGTRARARGMTQSLRPAPALPDAVRANFAAMLLVAVAAPLDPLAPLHERLESAMEQDGLAQALVGRRLFGGWALPMPGQPRIPVHVLPMDAAGDWTRASRRLRGARVMTAPPALPDDAKNLPPWMQRPLARALRPHMLVRAPGDSWRRLTPTPGMILRPALIGYAHLNSHRILSMGRRNDGPYPHRFVEPVIGCVAWTWPRCDTLPGAFWSHTIQPDGSMIAAADHPTRNPVL